MLLSRKMVICIAALDFHSSVPLPHLGICSLYVLGWILNIYALYSYFKPSSVMCVVKGFLTLYHLITTRSKSFILTIMWSVYVLKFVICHICIHPLGYCVTKTIFVIYFVAIKVSDLILRLQERIQDRSCIF